MRLAVEESVLMEVIAQEVYRYLLRVSDVAYPPESDCQRIAARVLDRLAACQGDPDTGSHLGPEATSGI